MIPDFQYSTETVEEHKRILSSLKKRDGEDAEKAMSYYLRALDKYLRDIQKKPLNARISWALERGFGKRK